MKRTITIIQMHFLHSFYVALTLSAVFLTKSATATNAVSLDLYKNKDVLATRTIPDLTALRFAHVNDQRNEYFVKLLAAWDTLQFDRTFISRGKSVKQQKTTKKSENM